MTLAKERHSIQAMKDRTERNASTTRAVGFADLIAQQEAQIHELEALYQSSERDLLAQELLLVCLQRLTILQQLQKGAERVAVALAA